MALLDAALLVASAPSFQWLFVISGLGRVVAGTLGGYLEGTMHAKADQGDDS